ncbi:MAG: hypothetical protein ABMB14_17860 [Myxococcota bacterium]
MIAWLEGPVPLRTSVGFRWFVAVKVAAFELAHGAPALAGMLLVLGGLLAVSERRAGWIAIGGVLAWQIAARFPWAPNHHYVELALVALLAGFPDPADGRPIRAAGALIVLCFLGSAWQKAFHGRWHDGEFLVHAALYGPDWSCLPWLLREGLGLGAALGASPWPTATPTVFGGPPPVPPAWGIAVCRALSWVTLAAEVAVPLAVVWPRTRRAAWPVAVALQLVVSGAVGIWGFGLTGLACWWTWSDRRYGPLVAATVIVAAVGALCDALGCLPWVWQ